MKHKTLCFRDGFPDATPWLRSEVRRLQIALKQAGYQLKTDGFFGQVTETKLKAFQRDRDMAIDGVASAPVWAALEPHLKKALGDRLAMIAQILNGFHGDLDWLHLLEGHRGRPYWPGGESGITLDPGVDLGYADPSLIENLFKDRVLSGKQMKAVKGVQGIRGEKAKRALAEDPVLQGIRISRKQANEIMPFAAKPYWRDIVARFPNLSSEKALPAAQTVLLSLAYNRGPDNPELEVLEEPIQQKDWAKLAGAVGGMQQDHPSEGVRKRRLWEAQLIKSELN